MCEFTVGDSLRFLPCMHIFHKDCIDDWLMRSFTCPSCMEPVDAALLTTYETSWSAEVCHDPCRIDQTHIPNWYFYPICVIVCFFLWELECKGGNGRHELTMPRWLGYWCVLEEGLLVIWYWKKGVFEVEFLCSLYMILSWWACFFVCVCVCLRERLERVCVDVCVVCRGVLESWIMMNDMPWWLYVLILTDRTYLGGWRLPGFHVEMKCVFCHVQSVKKNDCAVSFNDIDCNVTSTVLCFCKYLQCPADYKICKFKELLHFLVYLRSL